MSVAGLKHGPHRVCRLWPLADNGCRGSRASLKAARARGLRTWRCLPDSPSFPAIDSLFELCSRCILFAELEQVRSWPRPSICGQTSTPQWVRAGHECKPSMLIYYPRGAQRASEKFRTARPLPCFSIRCPSERKRAATSRRPPGYFGFKSPPVLSVRQ